MSKLQNSLATGAAHIHRPEKTPSAVQRGVDRAGAGGGKGSDAAQSERGKRADL